jgi:hypothetical protein
VTRHGAQHARTAFALPRLDEPPVQTANGAKNRSDDEEHERNDFLASEDASYMSGQVLHPNGGNVVGS